MLTLANMLQGIKPAPIPDYLVREIRMDKNPPRIILEIEEEPDEESESLKTSSYERLRQRHAVVHAIIKSNAGTRGMRLKEICSHFPFHAEHLIASSAEWLLKAGKIRTIPRLPGKGSIYWPASE